MDTPQIPHFMPGGLGQLGAKLSEDEENKKHLKISNYISEMDAELKDRFKALKSIQDLLLEADEEEQKEIRKLELLYEDKYKEVYALREALISGKADLEPELIKEFDERAALVKDEDYEKVEVTPCDVKSIQNIPKGVSDFWMKALINSPMGESISEKDRPILGYLQNVQLELHQEEEKGDGFDLIFTFAPNSYFDGTQIKKTVTRKNGNPIKTQSTEIKWKDACNPTIKKQKKKKKGKKVTVEVKCESFFNIFETIDPENAGKKDDEKKEKPEDDEDGDYDEADELNMKLQEDHDIAEQLKDDLVPLALEYYLGVIENEGEDDEDDEDDDDEDEGEQKKKKKGKKGGMPTGPDG
eukprot:CAMPEP_0170483162 /NCGR_PEP_ID=MMETSP0208-20121228/2894_1 /TAXON_ID=197538 /ORGANISM="Strombidium inclinatum, Strain S3" /LENGTH=354 /DNA_ID=CAMNT_0010756101 /DNA_START=16 /DNA_END=1077 /DNA_ORIENTATION=-